MNAPVDSKVSALWDVDTTPYVHQVKDDERTWIIILNVKVKPRGDEKIPYQLEVEALGSFRVADDWPQDKIKALVYANGTSLLYGAAREMISSITARGPYEMITLPTMSFTDTVPKPSEKGT